MTTANGGAEYSIDPFEDEHELLRFARSFLAERLEALERDVHACILAGSTAAFPAILYAFSTVDLLGALAGGDSARRAKTTEQSKRYMRRFMHYSEDQCGLLMELFRHKIVHLAQPNAVVTLPSNGKKTTWAYWHEDREHHLKLVPLEAEQTVQVTSKLSYKIEQRFEVSIVHFVADIVDSVNRPGGYLHSLELDGNGLQGTFRSAINGIYTA